MKSSKNKVNQDYSWIVLLTGTFVVFGALGLGRYGYTMVLPLMQEELSLGNSHTGLLATVNLSGYLAFALIGGALASRFGIRLVASVGLFVAGLSMFLTGLAEGFFAIALWRGFTGLGSGAANVAVMGLWAAWFSKNRRGFASGIAVSGSSLGLIFTGLLVPWLINDYGITAWRISWYIFGFIAMALSVISLLLLRNDPLKDLRKAKPAVGNSADEKEKKRDDNINGALKGVYLSKTVWVIGLVYAAFGFSYIIYMTFFVKYLMGEHGYDSVAAGNLFMIMGWISVFCGIIWGTLSDYIGRRNALIAIFLIHTVSFSLFAAGFSVYAFVISALLFGLSAWSIPAIMAAKCGDMLGSKMAPAALGFITLFFGIGQAIGPLAGGYLADNTGSFVSSFILAATIAFLGAVGATLFLDKG